MNYYLLLAREKMSIAITTTAAITPPRIGQLIGALAGAGGRGGVGGSGEGTCGGDGAAGEGVGAGEGAGSAPLTVNDPVRPLISTG